MRLNFSLKTPAEFKPTVVQNLWLRTENWIRQLPLFWQGFLPLAFFLGLALRLSFLEDMEFKEDEHYDFIQSQLIGHTRPWPWEGMPSGVYIPNPGMSIWIFVWLARISGAHDPVALMRALAIFAMLGLFLILPFCLFFLSPKLREAEQKAWLWSFALACVNPLEVYIQRKLWPEPFFPVMTLILLMGYFRRSHWGAAFIWGLMGACLGQVHMSGFFFAFALFLWTLFSEYKPSLPFEKSSWSGWFAGSCIGTLPLIPWAWRMIQRGVHFPAGHSLSTGSGEALQLKFWVFWLSDSVGLHLGNPLGILRGPSHWNQLSDFIRFPQVFGHSTGITGLAHLGILLLTLYFLGSVGLGALRSRGTINRPQSDTAQSEKIVLNSAFFGFGLLMTATGVVIRRYYMRVSFPLEHLWLSRLALRWIPRPDRWLLALWILQLLISASFVAYIHVHQGALQGDYGEAFHLIRDRNLKTTGKPWAELPNDYGY